MHGSPVSSTPLHHLNPGLPRRMLARSVIRIVITSAALIALYVLLPDATRSDSRAVVELVVGLVVFVGLMVWQVRSIIEADYPGLDLVLVESGGDNLTATFSYGLVHRQIFVIDVAGGDKVPRKGGPGVTRSDLLVINKTDLAPLVGADLAVMARDAGAVREARPTLFTSLRTDPGATDVADWVRSVRTALAVS